MCLFLEMLQNCCIYTFTLVLCITMSRSFIFSEFDNNTTEHYYSLSTFINNLEEVSSNDSLTNTLLNVKNSHFKNNDYPPDCSQREKWKTQPLNTESSRLKKCCPIGESLSMFKENHSTQLCDSSELTFHPVIINAILYDNCIEDIETEVHLPLEIGNPCNTSILYNSIYDMFYVLQNGALLIMDEFGNQSYTLEKQYCLDTDIVSGATYAIVCITSVEEHLKRSEIVTIAVLMLISIPCLIAVSYVHIRIKSLRTLHGLSLSMMSLCLAMGYFFLSLVHIFNAISSTIAYTIQFFMLSYFFWFLCICLNVCLNIWYKIPLNKRITKAFTHCNFGAYCFVSFCGPACLVTLTIQKGLPGMPSYFIRGFTESIRESQRYFIPPVTSILILSFIAMVTSFFGFQRVHKNDSIRKGAGCNEYLSIKINFDEERYQEVKKDAKCISLLGIIMITTWLLEIVTFYSPGPESYLIILEMINGIQGVFILLIFIVVRRRRTIILRWWHDRGSHEINNVELAAMNH